MSNTKNNQNNTNNTKNKNKAKFQGGPRNLIIGVLFVVGCIMVLAKLTDYTRQIKSISYATFLNKIEQGEIKKVQISGQDAVGIFKDGSHFETVIADTDKNWDLLKTNNVDFSVVNPASQINLWYIFILVSVLGGLLLAAWYVFRQTRNSNGGGAGNIFSMGKSRAKMFMPSTIKENFNSVAGATEAKEELKDVVDFLKNPDKFKRLGAKITRGVLLVGEPGNGKTLLAKAVAGEANCPFFSISGSDFIEVFVGIGAARVRDLFAQAAKHAPCIVFIDEIDAVGRHRGSGLGGGHDEREQTLNQLLTEMDGFQTGNRNIIVLAATNRPDVLDKALLRPGRFDRRVEVPYPDLISRDEILRLHAKNVKIDAEVDLHKIARGTPGFSGADLANIINEAAIIASKNNEETVKVKDFEEARDKILLGKESKTKILSQEERKITAFHEAGHALVRLLLPEETEPLHKVTIVPRGQSLGVTHWLPERDKYHRTKKELLASIKSALGGRIAEEIAFDYQNVTGGASDDFKKATQIVRYMVCDLGMSEKLGPVVYGYDMHGEPNFSQGTAQKIDDEVRSIMNACYDSAKNLLVDNRDKLDVLAQALLEKETLYASDIYSLLNITPRAEHSFS
jgi:cell division protease FtsH